MALIVQKFGGSSVRDRNRIYLDFFNNHSCFF